MSCSFTCGPHTGLGTLGMVVVGEGEVSIGHRFCSKNGFLSDCYLIVYCLETPKFVVTTKYFTVKKIPVVTDKYFFTV